MSVTDIILFIIAFLYLLMCAYTKHVYKCEHMGWSNPNVGHFIGTILSVLTEAIAWYWFFKYLKMMI